MPIDEPTGQSPGTRLLHAPDPEATEAIGRAIAPWLEPGDVVTLDGPLGAGKSALVRAVIAAMLARDGRAEDIPSPSYTLVQTYDTAVGPVWHADLYRLGDPWEVLELGLEEAFARAICLVEWPDRLGAELPARRLAVSIAPLAAAPDTAADPAADRPDNEAPRQIRITPHGPGWQWLDRLWPRSDGPSATAGDAPRPGGGRGPASAAPSPGDASAAGARPPMRVRGGARPPRRRWA